MESTQCQKNPHSKGSCYSILILSELVLGDLMASMPFLNKGYHRRLGTNLSQVCLCTQHKVTSTHLHSRRGCFHPNKGQ